MPLSQTKLVHQFFGFEAISRLNVLSLRIYSEVLKPCHPRLTKQLRSCTVCLKSALLFDKTRENLKSPGETRKCSL